MSNLDYLAQQLKDKGEFDSEDQQKSRALQQSLETSFDSNPDEAARNSMLADKTGLPEDFVERNPQDAAKKEFTQAINFDDVLKNAPSTAEFLSDLRAAKQARDDVPMLERIEKAWRGTKDLGRSVGAGAAGGSGMGLSGMGAMVDSTTRRVTSALDVVLPDSMDRFIWMQEDTPDWIKKASKFTMLSPATEMQGGQLKDIAEQWRPPQERQNFATSVGEAIGQIASQIALSLTNPYAGGAMMLGMGADQQVDRLKEAGEAPGSMKADTSVLLGAGVTLALEKTGLDILLNRLPPEIKNRVLRQLTDITIAGGYEATQEVVEGVGQSLIEFAFYNPDVDFTDGMAEEFAVAGTAGTIVRAMVNAATPGRVRIRSEQDAGKINEVISAVEESKLTGRNKGLAAEYLDKLAKDTDSDTIYIDSDGVGVLFQEINDPTIMDSPIFQSIAEQYQDAYYSGDKIRVKLSDLPSLVETGLARQLQPYMTTDADALSPSKNFNADILSEMQRIQDDVEAGAMEYEADVYNEIMGQEIARGVDRTRAEKHAALWSSTLMAYASRMPEGTTALELYNRFNPSSKNQLPPALAEKARRIEQMDLLLDTLRAGKTPKEADIFGESLLTFIRREGGIIDDGGELSARDATSLIRNNGLTLDGMVERAIEDGFINEDSHQVLLDAIDRELRGNKVFRTFHHKGTTNQVLQDRAGDLDRLSDLLGRLGFDLDQMTNAEVVDALERSANETRPANMLDQFAGMKAATADFDQLERAQLMRGIAQESDQSIQQMAETIFSLFGSTGWYLGTDGNWRFEIDDSKARMKNLSPDFTSGVLSDVLDHADLFAAYPDLANIPVNIEIDPNGQMSGEYFSDGVNTRITATGKNEIEALSVLLHEIQHYIQEAEGFAPGGVIDFSVSYGQPYAVTSAYADALNKYGAVPQQLTVDDFKAVDQYGELDFVETAYDNAAIKDQEITQADVDWFNERFATDLLTENDIGAEVSSVLEMVMDLTRKDLIDSRMSSAEARYENLAGEEEARNTQARMDMTAEERRATFPAFTSDLGPAGWSNTIIDWSGSRTANMEREGDKAPASVNVDATTTLPYEFVALLDSAIANANEQAPEPLTVAELKEGIKEDFSNAVDFDGLEMSISFDEAIAQAEADGVITFTPTIAGAKRGKAQAAMAERDRQLAERTALMDALPPAVRGQVSDLAQELAFLNSEMAMISADTSLNDLRRARLMRKLQGSIDSVREQYTDVIANMQATTDYSFVPDGLNVEPSAPIQINPEYISSDPYLEFGGSAVYQAAAALIADLNQSGRQVDANDFSALLKQELRDRGEEVEYLDIDDFSDKMFVPADAANAKDAAVLLSLQMDLNGSAAIGSASRDSILELDSRRLNKNLDAAFTKTLKARNLLLERPQQQPSQTNTPAFKRWFGESKVVDENGKPLVVYHGTNDTFTTFDKNQTMDSLFWFTSDKAAIERGEVGAAGSENIMPVYLSAKNLAGWPEYESMSTDQIIQAGFDGIKLDNDYIVFEPNQIKSATGNTGAFDATNDNILYQTYSPEEIAFFAEYGIELQGETTNEQEQEYDRQLRIFHGGGAPIGYTTEDRAERRRLRQISQRRFRDDAEREFGEPVQPTGSIEPGYHQITRAGNREVGPSHYTLDAAGATSGTPDSAYGVWAASKEESAANYGDVLRDYIIHIKKPLVIDGSVWHKMKADTVEQAIKERDAFIADGYDGLIITSDKYNHFVSFTPESMVMTGPARMSEGWVDYAALPTANVEFDGGPLFQRVATTDTPAFKAWFGDSKIVDANGMPMVMYHGTGNIDSIMKDGFNPDFTGKGMDQIGSGFYFTNMDIEARGYTTAITQNITTSGVKLGGDVSPGIAEVYLSIQNPIYINGDTINDGGVELTVKQASKILEYSKALKADDDSNVLGDYFDEFWQVGPQKWMLDKLAEQYANGNLIALEGDLFDGDATGFRRALNEVLGYDGVIQEFRHGGRHAVAWFPEQIKSVDNTGSFDPTNPNILYQKLTNGNPENNLYVAHNLSFDNLRWVDKIGGLAAPSLAIAKTTVPFESFGEITLLAAPSFLNDKKTRTFDADIYSPRQKRAEYDINRKGYDYLMRDVRASLEADNLGEMIRFDMGEVERRGLEAIAYDRGLIYYWMKEQGKAPKPVKRKTTPLQKAAIKEVEASGIRSFWSFDENSKLIKLATKHYEKIVADAMVHKVDIADRYFDIETGQLKDNYLQQFGREIMSIVDSGGVDVNATKAAVEKKTRSRKVNDEYLAWANTQLELLTDRMVMLDGETSSGNKRFKEYTLENIVRDMTKKLQGGEDYNYGPGSIRSAYAKEFKRISDIQADRDRIVSAAEMESLKEESKSRVAAALQALKPFYKFNAESYHYSNDAASSIMEGPRGLSEAFTVNEEVRKIVGELTGYLAAMPSEYFEAKVQRAVDVSEFEMAVVPKDTPKDVLDILKNSGVKVKTYDSKVDGDRSRVISEQDQLLFQAAYHGSPYRFDRFSLDAIGTGEGAQAYGWGLYFAGNRAIAEWYKANIPDNTYLVFEQPFNDIIENAGFAKVDEDALILFIADFVGNKGDINKTLKNARQHVRSLQSNGEWSNADFLLPVIDALQAAVDAGLDFPSVNLGTLFEVDIPSSDVLLDYDKPLAEQNEYVKERLLLLNDSYITEAITTEPVSVDGGEYWSYMGETYSSKQEALNDNTALELITGMRAKIGNSPKQVSMSLNAVGIPGLQYLDADSRDSTKESHNFVIWDENAVTVDAIDDQRIQAEMNQRGKSKGKGSGAAGGVRGMFNPSTFEMTFTKDQNMSTFLHESGHAFLQIMMVLADESPAIRKDLDILEKWWKDNGKTTFTEKHESFASAVETYFMEGKAPTPELRSLFHSFRVWLLEVYKGMMRGPFASNNMPGMELSDEVRGVIDRMVATQDAIDAAKEQAAYGPVKAEMFGLPPDKAEEYRIIAEEADERAMAELTAEAMGEYQREQARWWKDELANVRDEVKAEVDTQQVYVARDVLTGEREAGGLKPKMDRKYIKDAYGEAALRKLMKMTSPTGSNPSLYASMFGYANGDDLVMDLINSMTKADRDKYVKAEALARMKERHGDMLNDGTLEAKAEKAVKNTKQADRMLMELAFLNSKVGKPATPREIFKAAAEDKINGMKIMDIRPNVYSRNEQRARMAAFKAAATGDFQTAALEMQRAVFQHYMFKQATQAIESADKAYAFGKTLMRGKRAAVINRAGDTYIAQVDSILSWLEFKKVSAKGIKRAQAYSVWLESQLESAGVGNPHSSSIELKPDEQALKDLSDAEDSQKLTPDLSGAEVMMAVLPKKNYRELTPAELAEFDDMLRSVYSLARLKDKLMTNQDKRKLGEWIDVLEEALVNNATNVTKRKLGSVTPKSEQFKKRWQAFYDLSKTPAGLIRMFDGFADGGDAWQLLGQPLQDAATQETKRMKKANEELEAIFSMYDSGELAEFNRMIPGERLTKNDLISILLNWGNETNRARVMDGFGIKEAEVERLFDAYLTKKDTEFAQAIWDHLDTYREESFQLHKDFFGFTPEKVEAMPVVTKWGTLRGGYYPIKYDTNKSAKAEQHLREKESAPQVNSINRKNKLGSTQARVAKVSRPLNTDLTQVVFGHVADVVHSITHDRALYDVGRVLANDRIKNAINDNYGEHVYKALTDVIREVKEGGDPVRNQMEVVVRWARNNATLAMLGSSIRTIMLQPFGITNSIAKARLSGMGTRKLVEGYGKYMGNLPAYSKEIRAKSDYMAQREEVMNVAIARITQKIERRGGLQKLQELSMVPMQKMQWYTVDAPLWLASYDFLKARGESEADAVKLADQFVRDAQGGGNIIDTAQGMRGNAYQKLFTNFLTYMMTTFNIYEESRQNKIAGKINPVDHAINIFALAAMPAILMVLLNDFIAGPEDDEPWYEQLAREQASFLLGMNPLTAQFGGIASGFDYSGPQGTALISKTYGFYKQIAQGEADAAFAKSAIWVLGLSTGLPAAQINRSIFGAADAIENDEGLAKIIKQTAFGPER